MFRFRLRNATSRIAHSVCSSSGLAAGGGMIGGASLLTWLHQYLATFGTSRISVTALATIAALAVFCGLRIPHTANAVPSDRRWPIGPFRLGLFGIAVWTIFLPSLAEVPWSAAATLDEQFFVNAAGRLAFLTAAAGVLVFFPILLLAAMPGWFCRELEWLSRTSPASANPHRPSWTRIAAAYLLGVAAGLMVCATLAAPLVGLQGTAMISTGLAGAVIVAGVFDWNRHSSLDSEIHASPSAAGDVAADATSDLHLRQPAAHRQVRATTPAETSKSEPIPNDSSLPSARRVSSSMQQLATAGLVGATVAVLSRLVHQLSPASGWFLVAEWACLFGGMAWGCWLASRILHRQNHSTGGVAGMLLVLGAWPTCLLALFPNLVHASLLVNSGVSQVWLAVLLKSLIPAIVYVPIGLAWAYVSLLKTRQDSPSLLTSLPAGFLGGFLLARWVLIPEFGVASSLVAASWGALLLAAWRWSPVRRIPARPLSKLAAAASIIGILAGPSVIDRYAPQLAAKVLFSTNVFLAYGNGTAFDRLPYLDEGRCLKVFESERSTYTVWKYRGSQIHVREGGIPKAVLSTDVDRCPQFSAEVMQAAIPLVLHERPRQVLVLDLQGGVPLETCLSFPVAHVTCAEADAGLRNLVRKLAAESGSPIFDDNRVRMLTMEAPLALAAAGPAYDVIISSPDQGALLQAASCFTANFYRAAARRLSANGIFCQRLQFVDFGPQPLQVAARTLQTAFRDTMIIETAPGELVLLGTNGEAGLVRNGLLERIQAPHVVSTLSRVGWDWSMLLNLPAYNQEGLHAFAAETAGAANTATNGRFTFVLPLEVMRWGPKVQKAREALAPHASRLLAWIGEDGSSPDVLRRLAELTGQQRLMTSFPDEYWMYRKTVKKQITTRPRSLIRQVKGEDPTPDFHPVDERRMAYFKALGEAARKRSPSREAIRRIAEFESPYDPLISYFLHQEVAELYARSEDRDLSAELAHRLYAIYYSPGDRSVRNVAAALRLLVEHPAAEPDPLRRWDEICALLHVLRSRWEARGAVSPKSSNIVLNDIEKSLSALELAFAEMDELTVEAGLDPDEWNSRREFLEKSIERPLRTYRTRILPHFLKARKRERESQEARQASADAAAEL